MKMEAKTKEAEASMTAAQKLLNVTGKELNGGSKWKIYEELKMYDNAIEHVRIASQEVLGPDDCIMIYHRGVGCS